MSDLLLLLLASFPAFLRGQGAVPNQSFPLPSPVLSEACACDEDAGQGFSSSFQRCMKGTNTPCTVCPYQKKCAKVETVVGDGIRAFLGDCRITPFGSRSKCSVGPEASLAFPVSIARDDADNLYIADFGNNRIRKWDAKANTITTIAGTGEIGFSGDGGEARFARMRQPEGIAVKPGVPLDSLQVYFSDFKNQRIRRLTLTNGKWFIDTVAGIGAKGDAGPACDTGCNATSEAVLHNPRALAFSSVQDLYIVDSGNRKIRMLSSDGVFSTLVGNGAPAPGDSDMPDPAPEMMPGHWVQHSRDLTLGTVYFLNIDGDDTLWFADGPSPRLWSTELYNRKWEELDGASGRMYHIYRKNFFKSPGAWLAVQDDVLNAFERWLPLLLNQTLGTSKEKEEYRGMTKWRYGKGRVGNWCKADSRELCKPAAAQEVGFAGINGLCFDAANNIFISDSEASEILYLNTEPDNIIAARTVVQTSRMTTRNCPCFQYWFNTETRELPASISRYVREDQEAMFCRQNPEARQILTSFNSANLIEELPDCETETFCEVGEQGIEECAVDPRDGGDCSGKAFCSKPGLAVNFKSLAQTAVLGGELRMERKAVGFSSAWWRVMKAALLNVDMWLREPPEGPLPFGVGSRDLMRALGLSRQDISTAILRGFVDPGVPHPPTCKGFCCGLPQWQMENSEEILCRLRTWEDTVVLDDLVQFHENITLIISALDGIRMSPLGADDEDVTLMRHGTREDCAERCMLDVECTSYMVPYNETSKGPRDTGTCAIFRQNHPYHIYKYNRPNVSSFGLQGEELKRRLRKSFDGPISPYSHLFNTGSNAGIYISIDGWNSPDLLRDHSPSNASLNLGMCQDACIATEGCYAIAYPGCHMLNRSTIYSQEEEVTVGGGDRAVSSMVYVKKYMDEKIEGITGSEQVFTFNGDDRIRDTFLNKPTACVVSSQGEVFFADMWNQRIRKIVNYNLDCLNAVFSGRRQFQQVTRAMSSNCTSSPRMEALYARAQKQVVEQRSLATVETEICRFPTASASGLSTDNTMVLCKICDTNWPRGDPQRPAVCPWEELCDCTGMMAEGIKSEAFKFCPHQNAYHDKWHVWISSFIHCLAQDSTAADYLDDNTKRAELVQELRSSPGR